jgi:hypothetical protein
MALSSNLLTLKKPRYRFQVIESAALYVAYFSYRPTRLHRRAESIPGILTFTNSGSDIKGPGTKDTKDCCVQFFLIVTVKIEVQDVELTQDSFAVLAFRLNERVNTEH